MIHIWFIYSNNEVQGPFTTQEVKENLASGEFEAQSFIWWKGQREWIPVARWEENLDRFLKAEAERTQKPVWYINSGGPFNIGPLTRFELIDNLRGKSDLANVKLWATGMENWVSLYELHDVMEDLGISRRELDRAPLMGTVAVNRTTETPKGFVLNTTSVSSAGIGIVGSHDLHQGDEVSLMIKSAQLPPNVHLKGQVVYAMGNGYAGIRFSSIPPEIHRALEAYVRRFRIHAKIKGNAA